MIKLTIIISVYNQEELVIKALNSIPSRSDIEIIVIDDGSSDDTWNKLLQYRDNHITDKNIILLYNEVNKGVGYTKNVGLNNATGEYLVELDSDDYFYEDNFTKAIEQLDGTDLIYFNLLINNGTIFRLTPETKRGYCGSTKFIRREFIGETRYKEILGGEDYYFYRELLEKNPSEKYTDLVVKHYNFPRENSLSWKMRKERSN